MRPQKEGDLGEILQDCLDGPCAPDFVESLRDRSGGNPFFAPQMLRLLQLEGRLVRADAGWRLSAASSLNLPAAVRETVKPRIPAPRRSLLHGRAALALERLYGDRAREHAAELAYHFGSAGQRYLERALHYSLLAAEQAEIGLAHVEAERHYCRALELTRRLGDTAREANVLERLGVVLTTQTQYGEALTTLDEAEALYRAAGDVEGALRTTAKMGRVLFLQRTIEELTGWLRAQLRGANFSRRHWRSTVGWARTLRLAGWSGRWRS